MYEYRRLSAAQKKEIVAARIRDEKPWHRVEHRVNENQTYLLTGACFEHAAILETETRRLEWEIKLLNLLEKIEAQIFAWCVLPNHYHVLARLDLTKFNKDIGRLHNGTATQWNREDRASGRKVWYSYSERGMRSERHFYASMNYIHANPVKHRYVLRAQQWPTSSVHFYLDLWGREALQQMWIDYPVLNYGADWDEFGVRP